MHEFLLLKCRVNKVVETTDIIAVQETTANTQAAGIYNASGVRIPALQKGLNIVRTANGEVKKIWVK